MSDHTHPLQPMTAVYHVPAGEMQEATADVRCVSCGADQRDPIVVVLGGLTVILCSCCATRTLTDLTEALS